MIVALLGLFSYLFLPMNKKLLMCPRKMLMKLGHGHLLGHGPIRFHWTMSLKPAFGLKICLSGFI